MQSTKNRQQAKEDFIEQGLTIQAFAKENGLSAGVVYEVLRGRLKGRRGQAHKAAVLLGLKRGIVK